MALSSPWAGRSQHAVQVFLNRLWVVGGEDAAGSGLNDVWSSADGTNWVRAVVAAPWAPRRAHSSVVFDRKLWVLGGITDTGPTNDAWSSVDGTNWVEATNSAPWAARGGQVSLAFANAMVVVVGMPEAAWLCVMLLLVGTRARRCSRC